MKGGAPVIGKTGAKTSMKPHLTQKQDQKIRENTTLTLKCNKGTWHIFQSTHKQAKCLCGHKRNSDFKKNTNTVQKTVKQTLESPDKGLLGTVATRGLASLRKKVKQQ